MATPRREDIGHGSIFARKSASVNVSEPRSGHEGRGSLITKTALTSRRGGPVGGFSDPRRPADRPFVSKVPSRLAKEVQRSAGAEHNPDPREVSRKQVAPGAGRNPPPNAGFGALQRPRTGLAAKSQPVRLFLSEFPEEFVVQNSRQRVEQDTFEGQPARRIMPSKTTISQSARRWHRSFLVPRGDGVPQPDRSGFILGPNFELRPSDDAGEEVEVQDRNIPEQAAKTVHRRQATPNEHPAEGLRMQMATKQRTNPGLRSRAVRESSELETDDDETEQLTSGMYDLTFRAERLRSYGRIPFLIRNLRKAFQRECELAGVPAEPPEPPEGPVSVIYRYAALNSDDDTASDSEGSDSSEREYKQREGIMYEWKCPLCRYHGNFARREVLEFHMKRDHSECTITWEKRQSLRVERWQLTVVVPEKITDSSESATATDDEDADKDGDDGIVGLLEPFNIPSEDKLTILETQSSRDSEVAQQQDSVLDEEPEIIILDPPPANTSSSDLIPKKFRAYSPTPSATTHSYSHTRSSTTQTQRQTTSSSLRGSLPGRYPTPPPQSNSLGPAAQYPFLPEPIGDEDMQHMPHSCRIGGPKIYDLLNTLPLEPFGVLSWAIVDREEELFETDEIPDGQKVVLALWNRWIMLNRGKFILDDYCKGVIEFVDQYWLMIHRAAGWAALRTFLVVLATNKYLKPAEVVKVLKHYESHTGMEFWYKDDKEGSLSYLSNRVSYLMRETFVEFGSLTVKFCSPTHQRCALILISITPFYDLQPYYISRKLE
ncbi:uncharacterized protein FIBRA_03280 [Fibroporia radiculosa]|uniref:Uncharacterized protein n=1 Tax=Fibroporia radiculosa TaxID=599839 RepID=J4HVW7_9APHY|nr:uncharacterized protein FIBRA_03280 [Fibroporia radiculosa]CCM01232.1 predicted protein [Fibroporia radiculosa]